MKIRFVIIKSKERMYLKFNDQKEVEYTKTIDTAYYFRNKSEVLTLIARELNGIFQVIEIYIK